MVVESKNDINASAKHRNGWETVFTIELLGGRKIALKTFEGLYVTADVSGRLRASDKSVGLWETFEFNFVVDSTRIEASCASFPEQEQDQEHVEKLICPVCGTEYDNTPENEALLDRHVNEHLEGLKCPVCFITFGTENQNDYETHVNSHFDPALNDFVSIENGNSFF